MSGVSVRNDADPGKLAYFKNPDFAVTPMVQGFNVDERACPGCIFSRSPHVNDSRCRLVRETDEGR